MNRPSILWLAGTCAAAVASAASAQNSDATASSKQVAATQAETNQGEIIITAQKRRERLLDVPQSVSVPLFQDFSGGSPVRAGELLTPECPIHSGADGACSRARPFLTNSPPRPLLPPTC